MKLTKQAEIGVQILELCARPQTIAPVTTRMAAAFAGTTKDHAARAVCKLARAGYLIGTRGRAGGIRLAVAPSRINVGDVLRLIEPSFGSADCAKPAGPFDALVRAARESFVATFDTFTIADLVADLSTSRLACLDCDLHSIVRRGRALSSSGHRPASSPPTAVPAKAAACAA